VSESREPGPPDEEPEAPGTGFQGWPSSLEEPALPRPSLQESEEAEEAEEEPDPYGSPPHGLRTSSPPWLEQSEPAEVQSPAEEPEPSDEAGPVDEAAVPDAPQASAGEEAEVEEPAAEPEPPPLADQHAAGSLDIPPGYRVLQGQPGGSRRGVGIVVARFNGEITTLLLESALAELERAGVTADAITVMPVPGAFELPLGAMALAKTRRYACILALGCVIRGETPHFEYVSGEAASGLQLAALETGIPVAYGVLTTENVAQAQARVDKGAEAARTALEMADLFGQLRMSAAQSA
jgi:6,7-dimethyl-8-ribityllumazine synthase